MQKRAAWAIGAVLLASCILFLWQLGAAPLQDYDEATYAQVTREMVASGNWLSLTHTGSPFLEKPPLFMWFSGIAEEALGESEFSLRLPSALLGIASVALVMAFAFELSGNGWVAALSGAILLSTAPFLETARQVRLDVPLAFFITLAAWAFVRGLRQPNYFLLFGVAAAFAFLTKDVIGLFAFVAAAAFALALRDFSWLTEKYFWWSMGLFLLLVLPWHVYETFVYGAAFWQTYIGYDVAARAAQNLFAVNNTDAGYVWFLARFAAPWTQVFVFGGLISLIYHRALPKAVWASAFVVCAVLALFFVAATKAPTYLVPLYPFMALAIALGASPYISLRERKFLSERYLAPFILTMLLTLGLVNTIYNGFHFNEYYAQGDELAREEKSIGEALKAKSGDSFYAFQTTTLGSIMFYSGKTRPLAVIEAPAPGNSIVLPSASRPAFAQLFPTVSTELVYQGSSLTLLEVLSEE